MIGEIPEYMMEGLRLYIENRVKPGGFMLAVLRNDLQGAVLRADSNNIEALAAYVVWLRENAPSACWGSPEAVDAWLENS